MFFRRSVVTAALLALCTGTAALSLPAQAAVTLSPAQEGWVQRIQDAMNAAETLRGRFEQIAADGQRTTGDVWLARPGRMRFQYDKPSPLLLVANDGKVVFRDSQLDQTTEIPLDRTPLGLLLGKTISLSGDVTITGFEQQAEVISLSVVRTADPGAGTLQMFFATRPLHLQGWVVTDAQGRQTQVNLSSVVSGLETPASLFVLPAAD